MLLPELKSALRKLGPRDLKELEDYVVSLRTPLAVDPVVFDFYDVLRDCIGRSCPLLKELLKAVGASKLTSQLKIIVEDIQGLSTTPFTKVELSYAFRMIITALKAFLDKEHQSVSVVDLVKSLDRYIIALDSAFPGYRGPFLAMVLKPRSFSNESHVQQLLRPKCRCGVVATHKVVNSFGVTREFRCQRCALKKVSEN